jgi:hypothetical protein
MAKAEPVVGLRFEGTVVRPGDTLVLFVRPPTHLTDKQARTLKDAIAEELPGVKAVIVEGFEQALVYRPDDGPFDRDALIERWAENFGINLASPVEAALVAQEADHVAGLVRQGDAR